MTLKRLGWLALLVPVAAGAQQPAPGARPGPGDPVIVDGRWHDWRSVPVAAGSALPLDGEESFGRLWVTNDQDRLLVRFEAGREISLQSGNSLELCLDIDHNPETGASLNSMGADFCWSFGDRRGSMVGVAGALEHQQIGLVSAPTVTSRTFELSLDRQAQPGGKPLFPSDTVSLLLTDGSDFLPAEPGGLRYVMSGRTSPVYRALPLGRYRPEHLRILSYNLNDHLKEPYRFPALGRILQAIAPDVILLQEIRSTATAEATELLRGMLPNEQRSWRSVKVGGEHSVIISPFEILRADSLGESGAVLLDVAPGKPVEQLLVVVLSAPCCNEHAWREREIAKIMDFLADARTPGGEIDLIPGTPMLLMGDANLVGPGRQLRTLLYGLESPPGRQLPDWDGTAFTDLRPLHSHAPEAYTWFGDDFPPGRLDYVIYSDASLEVGNNYVLHTVEMPAEELAGYGLERDDTVTVSDHLPLVVDLVLP